MHVREWPRYCYRADLVRVIDGDTLVVRLDLGVDVTRTIRVRIRNINAPERPRSLDPFLRYPEDPGDNAMWALIELLGPAFRTNEVYVRTHKLKSGADDKSLDRYVADIYTVNAAGELVDVGAAMIAAGFAVPATG